MEIVIVARVPQVYASSSRETDYGGLRNNRTSAANSGSLINVSFANGAAPPAKPQRTFSKPSLLLRSQSFNVQADVPASSRRSVGALHRLEESPPPLRSPNIVSSVSRSTKDLSAVLGGAVDDGYRSLSGSWAGASEQQQQQQQHHHHRPHDDPKKTVFMKGLLEHAPELYRTLGGGGHQQQDHRVAQQQTTTRRGSNDDYTETVRFTSKSDDPYRPSVTDTVQNFTKKTVPRDGRLETIESTETKTVTKSRYQNGQQRPGNGGGVVIEVRNGRN